MPPTKRAKSDGNENDEKEENNVQGISNKSKKDLYFLMFEATNYMPTLSEADKQAAESALELAQASENGSFEDLRNLYITTRQLQRHSLDLTLEEQCNKLKWLRDVSISTKRKILDDQTLQITYLQFLFAIFKIGYLNS